MVPYYHISLVHSNSTGSAWALSLEPCALDKDDGDVDDDGGEQDDFHIVGEDPNSILDQYLGEEELEKLIQKRRTFLTTVCHKRPHGLMFSMIFNLKNIFKMFWNN